MESRPASPHRRPAAWIAALSLGIGLAACQIPPAPTGTIEADGSPDATASAPASPDGATAAGSPSAAGELPAGFPIPPGAVKRAFAAEPGRIARWTLDDHGSVAYEFFLAELPPAGFPIEAALPGGAAAIIRFTTPAGGQLQIDLVGTNPVQIDLVLRHD